jgi:hypothetical protein
MEKILAVLMVFLFLSGSVPLLYSMDLDNRAGMEEVKKKKKKGKKITKGKKKKKGFFSKVFGSK